MFTCIVYSIFYTIYLLLGGFVFMLLESNGNIVFESEIQNAKLNFLSSNPCVPGASLDKFIEQVLSSKSLNLNASINADWTFGQSMFFATTLVTTIGKPWST
uniref:Potassium channel subfamily K member 16 n=1 Tax=Cacopsylla melanoneura TaxID=428564 RepID=A0A8D9AM32_9HEMI